MRFRIPPEVYGTVGGVPPPALPTRVRAFRRTVGPGTTLIMPEQLARRNVQIQNTDVPGVIVVIGNDTVTFATGFPLDGGARVRLTGTAAIYGNSVGGVVVAVLEEAN